MLQIKIHARHALGSQFTMESTSQQSLPAPKWTRLLVWSTIGSTIGAGVPGGYCIGVINNPSEHVRAWCEATLLQNYGLKLTSASLDALWALIVSIFLIGGILGAACAGWAANRFGRRGCFLFGGAVMFLPAFGFLSCRWLNSVELLVLCRIVVGIGSGVIGPCLPLYHSEIAAVPQRGTLGVCGAVGLAIGMVVGQLFSLEAFLGSEQHWHYALSFYGILMIICYAPFHWYAESPKWLFIVKQRREEALDMLVRLRGSNLDLQQEISAMEQEIISKCSSRSLLEVLKDSKMLLPVVLACAYQGGKQFVGCSAIFYYSVSIFNSSGFSSQTAQLLNLCAGTINLVTALAMPLLMAKYNRRPLMLLSTFLCGILMFAFAILVENSIRIPWLTYGSIVVIFVYIFSFQLGLGSIPSFIGAELFEMPSRSVGLSFSNQMSWFFSFVVAFMFPITHYLLGSWIFVVFGISSGLLFLLTKRYLPETRNREITVVAELISHGFRSKVV